MKGLYKLIKQNRIICVYLIFSVAIIAIYYSALRPINIMLQNEYKDLQRDTTLLNWVRKNGGALKQVESQINRYRAGTDDNLHLMMKLSLKNSHIRSYSYQSKLIAENRIEIKFDTVPFTQLITYINELNRNQGISLYNGKFYSTDRVGIIRANLVFYD